MADPDPEYPLIFEGVSLDAIRARMGSRLNLGIDPDSPRFRDVEPGSIFGDLTGPSAMEWVEFYDGFNLAIAASHPATSWGEHLDKWAESLGLERLAAAPAGGFVEFTGPPGTVITTGAIVTTETPTEDVDDVEFAVIATGTIPSEGTIALEVIAVDDGAIGNVPPGSVTLTDLADISAVTNPAAMTGGADIESDAELLTRIEGEMAEPTGAGIEADYVRWCRAHAGIGHVTVIRGGLGPGTVLVYVLDRDHNPVQPSKIAELQNDIDPVPGEGQGKAPVGAEVTIATPGTFGVEVVGSLVFDPGYSLDGDAGTIALREQLARAIYTYVRSLPVGGDVILHKVAAAIVSVRGIADIGVLELNGTTGNLSVPSNQVAAADPPEWV